ncbi:krev interaction trapped protein 1-like [Saccostrea cucullata]|uniref:krev interaction trapped protein 1-like n=1 Tax=Saccostrea cuccullata TaxID=36930 RepID=UPI002ED64BFD
MEVILAVVQPKQNVFSQEYRPKLYNILLLDHKTASSGEKGKPTKYLPTFPLTNVQEEAGDEVLANLYQLTGGDHVGIKGERALQIQWSSDKYRESLTRFALFCVPVNKGDKLNRMFVEKSPDYPGFFSLDYVIDTLNNDTVAYPPPTRTFISQLESWLREKHAMPGAVNILFSRRADYRVKLSVNNPAFLPSRFEHEHKSTGMVIDSTPDEIRHTAREALTRMLEIEKCEKVVLNPVFGSSFPCKPKVDRAEVNMYWGMGVPDYTWPSSHRNSSTGGSFDSLYPEKYHIHKLVNEGNIQAIRDTISFASHLVDEKHPKYGVPLHMAAYKGSVDAAKILLEAGCNTNALNELGQSPLHIAAKEGHWNVVQELIKRQETSLELLDKQNRTPLNLCEQDPRSPKHQKTANLIISAIKKTKQIQVFLMDGTSKMLNLSNGDNTTVQQLNLQLLRAFQLPPKPYAEYFTIWICSKSLELQLKLEHKPVEHINNWRRRIVSMLTGTTDTTKENPTLKWRRNAKVGVVSEQREVVHPLAIQILFYEAKHNYINALYPCKDQDVHTFASILILLEHGGKYDPGTAKHYLHKNISSLVPAPILKAKGQHLYSTIMKRYKEYCGGLQEEIKNYQNQYQQFLQGKFLEFCRKLTVYGSAFFTGNLQPNSKSSILCHIGVNDVGIHIINMKSKVMLYSFLYSDIRWSHPDDQPSFLEIYTVNDSSDPRQVKIKSRQAGLIVHLMQKLKDLHQFDDRQVNLVFGTAGRR